MRGSWDLDIEYYNVVTGVKSQRNMDQIQASLRWLCMTSFQIISLIINGNYLGDSSLLFVHVYSYLARNLFLV
jgi:hypothetical protein